MNFADEEYVRLYIRDTDTWRALAFEGQAVLALMLRRFDGSGVYEFGKRTPVRSIVAAIGCSEDFAAKGLEAILAEEVWEQTGTRFFWPTYDEAQHCFRSDKLRKREERARKASADKDKCHADVTNGPSGVTSVTNCPTTRTRVTPGEGEARERRGKDLDLRGSAEGGRDRFAETLEFICPDSVEFTEKNQARAKRCGQPIDELWELFRNARRNKRPQAVYCSDVSVCEDFDAWLWTFAKNHDRDVANGRASAAPAPASTQVAKAEPVARPGEIPCPADEFFLQYPAVPVICKRLGAPPERVLGRFRTSYAEHRYNLEGWANFLFTWLQAAEIRLASKGAIDVVKVATDVAVGDVRALLKGIGGDG